MKKINKNKLALALGLLFTGMVSQAQWATVNISDALYDYFRSMRDFVHNTNLEAISNGQQLQMAQANQNVTNADYRNRLAIAQNDILKRDQVARPSYDLCVEISKKQPGTVATSLNGSGRSKGGKGRAKGSDAKSDDYDPTDPSKIQENVRSPENAQAMVILNMKNVGACSDRYGDICAGQSKRFAEADVRIVGLLSNTDQTKVKKDANGIAMDFANYTMDAAAFKAAKQYINVATLANAPKWPDSGDLKKNPGYIALYNSMIIKLNAASEVLQSMADLRKAPTSISDEIKNVWNSADNNSDWNSIFPTLVKPDIPSMFEFLNFTITADVFGPQTIAKESTGSDSDTLKGIQSKIALNNYVAWYQAKQLEQNNILMSHILVQLTTPIQKEAVDREYQKFNQK